MRRPALALPLGLGWANRRDRIRARRSEAPRGSRFISGAKILMSRQQIGPIWPFSASIVWCTVCKSRRAWELFAMTTERPKARFKPPCRASAIRALVESRGEITRAELLEWARDGGWIEEGREGRERLYQALHSMRTVGTIDFDESGVRPGNPAKAKNLSRQKEVIRKKFSELSRMAIASLVQSLNGRSSTAASLEFAGEGVAL